MHISFFHGWRPVLAFAAGLLSCSARLSAGLPNFLVLVADDMRADGVHAHGGGATRTPVLDRLAGEGMSFRAAYCLGSNSGAVCMPSRAMLLSGRPYFSVPSNLTGTRTLPERLGESGYETFLAGKWHNGREACERSFEAGEAVFLGGMTDQERPLLARLHGGKLGPAAPVTIHATDAIAGAAARFLATRDRSRPFFAWVSFTVPHDPRTPKSSPEPAGQSVAAGPAGWRPAYSKPFAQLHAPSDHPPPPNFLPQHPFDNGWLTVRDEQLLAWPRDPAEISRELAAYHGLISHLDARIGDLMAALEETGDATNTFVVFLSDHGLALGSHGLLGKQSLYEHSMRAPLLVRGPGIPAGRSSDALVYLHDVHATVLELAGQPDRPPPHEVDSRSLVPHWQAPAKDASAPAPRNRLLLAFTDTLRAVRHGRWKLIRYPQVDVTQVFDLENDPHETKNLVDADPERAAWLRRELESAQSAASDTLPWSTAEQRPAWVDLTGRPRDPFAARPWDAPSR
jgi:arylsulfatase A-like enzyme